MTSKPFLKNLNGLRFLAASYTITFHYWSFPNSPFFSNFFTHGHISVPFFFLLSGFVLSYSYNNYPFFENSNIKKYLLNRFIRLAPIYYIAMFLSLILIIQKVLAGTVYSIDQHLLYSLVHLVMLQALFPFKDLITYWNLHSWSLSVELFLYLCSPWLISNAKKMNSLYISFFALTILNSIIFLITQPQYKIHEYISLHFSPLYLPIFFQGIILAKIFIQKRDVMVKYSSFLFIFSSFFLLTIFFSDFPKSFYSTFNPVFLISFSLLILSSSYENQYNSFLRTKTMIALGEASYAMYILQAPIKFFTQQFLSKVLGYKEVDGLIYCFTIYLAITACAMFISQHIDPKARDYMKKKLFNK